MYSSDIPEICWREQVLRSKLTRDCVTRRVDSNWKGNQGNNEPNRPHNESYKSIELEDIPYEGILLRFLLSNCVLIYPKISNLRREDKKKRDQYRSLEDSSRRLSCRAVSTKQRKSVTVRVLRIKHN